RIRGMPAGVRKRTLVGGDRWGDEQKPETLAECPEAPCQRGFPWGSTAPAEIAVPHSRRRKALRQGTPAPNPSGLPTWRREERDWVVFSARSCGHKPCRGPHARLCLPARWRHVVRIGSRARARHPSTSSRAAVCRQPNETTRRDRGGTYPV